jgi:nucleotide-binding universal stress UspA family protein
MTAETRFPLESILVVTAISYSGSCAIRYAKCIAEPFRSKLFIVRTIDPVVSAGIEDSPAQDEGALHLLEQLEEEIRDLGILVHSVTETQVTYKRILQTVRDHKVDLLILGTKTVASGGQTPLGAIGKQLLAAAPCPILTVPTAANLCFDSADRWRRVLVATDFSPESLRALCFAQSIAASQLVVVNAASDKADREYDLEVLRWLAPESGSRRVSVEHVTALGEPGEIVPKQAGFFRADLIILGSPSRESLGAGCQASTALQVISNVRCPVLCVPADQDSVLTTSIDKVAFCI